MPVVIRASGYAYQWTCKNVITVNGTKRVCNHTGASASETEAKRDYDRHKKTVKGH